MQSVNDYLAKVLSLKGGVYWNGCFFRVGTEQLWQEKSVQKETKAWFASHPAQKAKGLGKKCGDCCGVDKYARWVQPDGSVPYDGNTDLNEDGLYALAVSKGCKHGEFSSLPLNRRGLILKTTGHMEIYIGDGKSFGSRDSLNGVNEFPLNTRSWQYWYENPFIDYSEGSGAMLYKGCPTGESVQEWQESLMKVLSGALPKWGADSDFGGETEDWTNAFKASVGLPQDGKVDELTYAKMLNKLQSLVVTNTVTVNVPYEVIKEVPVEVIKEVIKEVQVIKEVPVEVIKEVIREVVKEVPTGISQDQLNAEVAKSNELINENGMLEKDIAELSNSVETLRSEVGVYENLLKNVDIEIIGSRSESAQRIGNGILVNKFGDA